MEDCGLTDPGRSMLQFRCYGTFLLEAFTSSQAPLFLGGKIHLQRLYLILYIAILLKLLLAWYFCTSEGYFKLRGALKAWVYLLFENMHLWRICFLFLGIQDGNKGKHILEKKLWVAEAQSGSRLSNLLIFMYNLKRLRTFLLTLLSRGPVTKQ